MKPKAVEEQTTNEHLGEMDIGIAAMDRTASSTTNRHDHSMASSDETTTIGSDGLLLVEEPYKNLMVAKFNKQPAGKADDTTAGHDMDPTEEPVKTFTSANHGKKPATNPNETSDTADLGKNPTGSPNNQNAETKRFNLLGCPDNVRQKILRYLLVSDRPIQPYWNLGSLEVAYWDSRKENFAPALAAFACNRQLVNEATTILYGENLFELRHARVTLWWLKRIGANVRKLKHLDMSFEEGPIDPFGIRSETLWYSIVLVLDAAQPLKLRSLTLSFADWTDIIYKDDGLNPRVHTEVWEPRRGVVRTLFRWRGVGAAVVKKGPTINQYCADTLKRALGMAPGQTDQEIIGVVARIPAPTRQVYVF